MIAQSELCKYSSDILSELDTPNPPHDKNRDATENQENLLRFPARTSRAANRSAAEAAQTLEKPFDSSLPYIHANRSSLISTKLAIPRPPRDLNRRQRLAHLLDQAIYNKVILISAPAGSGKTTLLTEWHSSSEESELPLAWLSLDDDDNDPQRFWTYFAAALNTINPRVGEQVLDLLRSMQTPRIEYVLTLLINGVTSISEDFALVLDDYHLIQSQEVHKELSFLIDHQPPQMHLIISTRAEPPLQLSRLRARGELAELRAQDLRFETDEIHSLFRESFDLELSDDELKLLEDRTEGWVAGLRMAALSMPRDGGIDEFLIGITGTSRHILDYLVDEVFEAQPEGIKSFLLKTSVLNRLNSSLCDATADLSGSQAILDELDKSNLFIVSLDSERQWYRYHHLFSEFLRGRLKQYGAEQIQELHAQAALWYEEHDLQRQAISHYLTVHDYTNAVRLIEQLAGPMLANSEVSTLQPWLDTLPDEFVVSRPRLCLSYAQSMLYRGQENAAVPWLDKAERGLNALESRETEDVDSEESGVEENKEIERMRGELAAHRGTQAGIRGRVDDAIQYCNEALKRLSEEDTLARARVAYNLGMAYLHRDENDSAERQFIQAKKLAVEAGDIHLGVIAHTWTSRVQHRRGQL